MKTYKICSVFIDNFDEHGRSTRRGWEFSASVARFYPFTMDKVEEILLCGMKMYKDRFNESANFNYIRVNVDTDNIQYEYWRDKKILRVWENDTMVHENNNGRIYTDCEALANCLI